MKTLSKDVIPNEVGREIAAGRCRLTWKLVRSLPVGAWIISNSLDPVFAVEAGPPAMRREMWKLIIAVNANGRQGNVRQTWEEVEKFLEARRKACQRCNARREKQQRKDPPQISLHE